MTNEAETFWKFLALGTNINRHQQVILLRVLWVVVVSGHILWVCGALAFFGFSSPFAKAGDFEQLQKTVNLTAELQLASEIRDQTMAMCRTNDSSIKESLSRYIESLQQKYTSITGHRYPDGSCR